MDTCCRYEAHLRNLAGPDILETVECWLGWLHSKAGHDIGCQLDFSGLYAEGFGRAIGENAEQLHVSPYKKVVLVLQRPCFGLSFPETAPAWTSLSQNAHSTDILSLTFTHCIDTLSAAGLFQAASQGLALHGIATLE